MTRKPQERPSTEYRKWVNRPEAAVYPNPLRKRRKERVMVNRTSNSGNEQPGRSRLAHTTQRSCNLGLPENLWIFIEGRDHNWDSRSILNDLACCLEAIAPRHYRIHDDNVRTQTLETVDSLIAITCLPANDPSVLCFEKMAQQAPHGFVIVYEQYSQIFHGQPSNCSG